MEPAAYLTAADVALMLKVSEKSVYRWAIQDPTMPALKVGGTVRFPAERLVKWLAARTQGSGSPMRARAKPLPAQGAA